MCDTTLDDYFICGGFSGLCSILVGHPFDTIKVRLQTMPVLKKGLSPHYSGSWDCFQQIMKREGLRGVYKGIAIPLFSVAPIFAVSFLTYGIGKQIFGCTNNTQIFAAGCFSGIVPPFLMSPGERIKCMLQVQNKSENDFCKGSIDCVKKIFRKEGLYGIFKGTGMTLVREVPGSGVYFLTYESLKPKQSNDLFYHNLWTFIAGGTAGVLYWIVGLPADVIKSRLQTSVTSGRKGTVTYIFKDLLRHEGFKGFYKGLTPALIRAFLSNAATFIGFDYCKYLLNRFNLKIKLPFKDNIKPVNTTSK